MKFKLTVFFSFFMAMCFAGLQVYDLSGSVEDYGYYLDNLKCSSDKKIVCWTDYEEGDTLYHCKAALWNGSSFDISDLSGGVDNIVYFDYAINAAGQAVVFWVENYPSSYKCAIWNGTSWDVTTMAENITSVDTILLALNADGKVIVTWTYADENWYYHVKGAYFNGTEWSYEILEPDPLIYIYNLDVDIDAAGLATITWLTEDYGWCSSHQMAAIWDGSEVLNP